MYVFFATHPALHHPKNVRYSGRSLAVGQALADNHPKVKQIKMGRFIQKKLALDLYKKANVLPGPCGLREA